LYRLKYAIEDDEKLSRWLLPLMFSEEQYGIIELVDFWESIAEYLEDFYGWLGILEEIKSKPRASEYYEENVYDLLNKWLKDRNKRIIVFVENINDFFKKVGDHGQKRLREVLTTSPYIRIIGSATGYFDGVIDYSKPFYEFFKIIRLDGLSKEETEDLLLRIGSQHNHEREIERIINNNPERVESLRRITGGVPRTISYLFQIFLNNEGGRAMKDLYQLLDHLTLLYKNELDVLSPQQQKIVDVIARRWDPISVKEITNSTRFDSKHISSILKQLEKNQVIEIIPTNTKNHLYRIRERFLNIWYLMRYGKRNDKEKVIWLVRFFDMWYDKKEMIKRVYNFIDEIKKDQPYDESAAMDLGMTFLSCENVPDDLRISAYETAKARFSKKVYGPVITTPTLFFSPMRKAVRKGDFNEAFRLLERMPNKNNRDYNLNAGWVYYKKKDYKKSSHYLEALYDQTNDSNMAMTIAVFNEKEIKDYDKAIKYYRYALEEGDYEAAHRLGHVYMEHIEDFEQGSAYFEIAIEHGIEKAILCFARILSKYGYYEKAEGNFQQAIDKHVIGAWNAMGKYKMDQGKWEEAERAFVRALDNKDEDALLNLGILHMTKDEPNVEKAFQYLRLAVEKENVEGYYLLGKYLLEENKEDKEAIEFLQKAAEKGHSEAMHTLGHHYDDVKNYAESDKFFMKAFENGVDFVLLCYLDSAFAGRRNDQKNKLLELFEKNLNIVKELKGVSMAVYSKLLLWNDRIDDSINNLYENLADFREILDQQDEKVNKCLVAELTDFFILLVSKDQFKAAESFFSTEDPIDFKDLLKPLYYAFLSYSNKDKQRLDFKISAELKETVDEIINAFNQYKMNYN
jgi:TPR repeat protein